MHNFDMSMFDDEFEKQFIGGNWHTAKSEENTSCQAVEHLRNGGTLAQVIPSYRERKAQLDMARLVTTALHNRTSLVCEAATGTGKTYAYLLPAVHSAGVTVVSTANKALQEQIFYKDIPFLQEHVQDFDAVLMKGMNNYVCLDLLDKEQHEGMQEYTQDATFSQVVDVVENDSTFDGDFERLPFSVPSELKTKIQADRDSCAGKACPLFQKCYYYKMKEQAKHAKVIVVNHHLLLLDASNSGRILPFHESVIVDECHQLEEVATDVFTTRVKPSQITSLLTLKQVKAHTTQKQRDAIQKQFTALLVRLETLFPQQDSQQKKELNVSLEEGLLLASLVEKLATTVNEKKPATLTNDANILFDKVVRRIHTVSVNLRKVFSVNDTQHVYYLERVERKRGTHIEIAMVPLDVAPMLYSSLFETNTVICTSATVATQGNFNYFRQRVGMSKPNTLEKMLPLVFDYKRQALLYMPQDIPIPAYGNDIATKTYERAIAARMLALVKSSKGRAFLLFSSKRMLEYVSSKIAPELDTLGFPVFIQGTASTSEIVKQFRSSGNGVLFGVKSFWEGVDVQGDALSLVVIDKLPFPSQDEPVHIARMRAIDMIAQTWQEKSFSSYLIPKVIIQLKQGVGRLIRSSSDTGVIAILDSRMTQKSYGKAIQQSLPPAKVTHLLRDVEQFFYITSYHIS